MADELHTSPSATPETPPSPAEIPDGPEDAKGYPEAMGEGDLCIRQNHEDAVLTIYAGEYHLRLTDDRVFENPWDWEDPYGDDDQQFYQELEREEWETSRLEYLAELPEPEKLVDYARQLQADGWHLNPDWDGSTLEGLDAIWEEDENEDEVARAFIPLHHACGEPMLVFGPGAKSGVGPNQQDRVDPESPA